MEPNRPNIDVIPNSDMRSSVGNISAVNTYIVLNAIVMAYLLPKNDNNFNNEKSVNQKRHFIVNLIYQGWLVDVDEGSATI
jgi:hypothetical protein